MEPLRARPESLLQACCEQIKPNWDATFDYVVCGAKIGLDESAASDLATELATMGYFKPLGYGKSGSLDRDGREYARTFIAKRLSEGAVAARLKGKSMTGTNLGRVFLSHSSKDKPFARKLAERLSAAGFSPWIDEVEIQVGQSITSKIEKGLDEADFVVVILSAHSVGSNWVDREWKVKYWDQINTGKTLVFPARIEECNIPSLLKDIKYADFSSDFEVGFAALISGMTPISMISPAQLMPPTDHSKVVTALLAKIHVPNSTLSSLLVETLEFAQAVKNLDLASFCRDELNGNTLDESSPEDIAEQYRWRVVECFASRTGRINRSFIAFQTETSTFQYIESHPDEFVPMFLVWGKPVGDIEHEASLLEPLTTGLEVRRKHGDLMTNSKTPEVDVYIYMRRDTNTKLLRAIRRELVSRLLPLLPRVQKASSVEKREQIDSTESQ